MEKRRLGKTEWDAGVIGFGTWAISADQVDVASDTERVEQFVGIKLLLGHRCDLLVVSCRTRRDSLRWSPTSWILYVIYTNSWESPVGVLAPPAQDSLNRMSASRGAVSRQGM